MNGKRDKSCRGVTAIVLAAGMSSRMGDVNKLLLPFAGEPLVRRVVAAVCRADIASCIVVLGHEAEDVATALQGLPVSFVTNPDYTAGMGTSIAAGVLATGLKDAGTATTGYLVCLSDMPLITTETYNAIIHKFEAAVAEDPAAIVRPRHDGQPGNPVLLSAYYREMMQNHRGADGCKPLVKQHNNHLVYLEMSDNHVLKDTDTPAAYEALKERSNIF